MLIDSSPLRTEKGICNMNRLFMSWQNDQSTGDIKVIGGDDLSTLTGKVSSENIV